MIKEVQAYEFDGRLYKTRDLANKAKERGSRKVIFELSMPNVGSWDGRWRGSKSKYTVESKLPKDKLHLIGKSFYYNFGDGWGASVSCRLKSRERPTNKFCGYEWMVKSIIKNEKIIIES